METLYSISDLVRLSGHEFIRAVYKSVLGREPDPEGEHYYLGRLNAGDDKYDIIAQIASSRERTKRKTFLLSISDDASFVTAAYQAILGREPDPDGLQHHLDFLQKGHDRRKVLDALSASPEGQAYAARRAQFEVVLDRLIREEERARHWFWRWFVRSKRQERQLNRMENVLLALEQQNVTWQHQIHEALSHIDHQLNGLKSSDQSNEQPTKPTMEIPTDLSNTARLMYKRLAFISVMSKLGE